MADNNIQLLIAGSQAWKYQKIYRLWQQSKVKSRIKFLGYVDDVDKVALYSKAELFVYPSIYEGFGLPPLESMACGTPVISSFTSSIVESVGGAGILVDPHNANDIAKVINLYLSDSDLREQLKNKARLYAQNFSWDKSTEKVLTLLNNL